MKIRRINSKNKLKRYIGVHLAIIVTLFMPMVTLTSCSNISQHLIPISTNTNPYYGSKVLDPFIENGQYEESAEKIEDDKKNIIWYLPKNYKFTRSYNANFSPEINDLYAYSYNTNNPNLKYSNEDNQKPWTFKKDLFNDSKWISTKDHYDTTSFQNYNIYIAMNSTNLITNNLLSLIGYMNKCQTKIIQQKNNDEISKKLSIVYANNEKSGFEKGEIGSQTNTNFFEFCYDEANLLSQGNSHFKFGPYDVEWKAKKSGVDLSEENNSPFPFLNEKKELIDFNYDNQENLNKKIPPFVMTNDGVGNYKYEGDNKSTYERKKISDNNFSKYFQYAYNDGICTDITGVANVPVLIKLNNILNGYYDPMINKNSIFNSDWLSTDKIAINNAINTTNVWSSFKNKTDSEPKISGLSFNQTFPSNSQSPEQIKYDDWWETEKIDLTKIDPTIKFWIENNDISTGDFIALANYTLTEINYEYKNKKNESVHFKTKVPYFSGYSTIFPAYLAFNTKCYKQINIDDKDNSYKSWVLDFSDEKELSKNFYKIINNLMNFKIETINEIEFKRSFDLFNNDPFAIFKWMYNCFPNGDFTTRKNTVKSSEIYKLVY